MDVSVIVCTYDRPSLLGSTLEGLLDQSMAADDYEVIVVYQPGDDATEATVQRYADENALVRPIHESDPGGLAHARNVGTEAARGEYVHFLDDDVRVPPDLLETMLRTFEEVEPSPVCVGGRVEPLFESEKPSWLPPSLPGLPVCDLGAEPHWIDFPWEYVIGANLAFTWEFVLDAGGFSTALGRKRGKLLANEEYELVEQADAASGVYYQPEASVDHVIGPERVRFRYLLRRFFWDGVSNARLDHLASEEADREVGGAGRRMLYRGAVLARDGARSIATLDTHTRADELFGAVQQVGYLYGELTLLVTGGLPDGEGQR
jgi:glycosyltransferase involved in cell wall biosynthesis